MAPPESPCRTRKRIWMPRVGDSPQAKLDRVKVARQKR